MSERQREIKIRRRAARRGLRVVKSRSRTFDCPSYGGFMVVDPTDSVVVLGSEGFAYSAGLDEIELFLNSQQVVS